MVDRGVRHLREALAQIGRQRTCPAGERRDRRVVPHRVDGVVAGLRERPEHGGDVLAGVAVEDLAGVETTLRRIYGLADVLTRDAVPDPLAVRLPSGELPAELGVDEQAPLRIDGEDASRPEARATNGGALGERNSAGLGRDGDEPVARHRDAERAQPVPVERGARHPAVREAERGGPVPGLR